MVLSMPRKRALSDVDDEIDLSFQPMEKKSRPTDPSTPRSIVFPSSSQPLSTIQAQHSSPAQDPPYGPDSPRSTVSEAGSSNDMDMSSDDATSDLQMTLSQSPPRPSSPWTLRPTPIRPLSRYAPGQPSSRVATPIVTNTIRPRPAPLQTASYSNSSIQNRSNASNAIPQSSSGGGTLADRLPSPIDEDEPHTPTTVAGSQLSLLTVTDMDVDVEPPDSRGPGSGLAEGETEMDAAIVVRKQRQRSGAFISTPDAARKFSMGYRDDCDKCRRRVPGHMNHFLGT